MAGVACVAAGATGLFAAGVAAPSVASAATTISYGFDGNAHLVVGGGSDTTYTTMIALGTLWNEDNTAANGTQCAITTSPVAEGTAYPPTISEADQYASAQQTGAPSPSAPAGTNCNHDNIAEAYPTGSSTGIASLNGNNGGTAGVFPYEGTNQTLTPDGSTHNGYGVPDFARSSRQPKTSGGNCAGGNELTCDTFWGIATDGVQVFSWNFGTAVNRGSELASLPGGLTADDMYHIWNCDWTTWSQVPGMSATAGFVDGPIVPWSMNTGSGTQATFQSWIINNASAGTGVLSTWKTNAQPCDKALADGTNPFENDVKPLLNNAIANGGIVDSAASANDPSNWIWWGSFGLMGAYPNLSSPTISGTKYNIGAATIYDAGASGGQQLPSSCSGGSAAEPTCTGSLGVPPSSSTISIAQYPISRDVYMVTPKASADCPLNTGTVTEGGNTYAAGTICDTTGTGTPSDVQINGATSGSAAAVREFVRFICRTSAAQQATDPFTGTNYFTEVTSALNHNGFFRPPLQNATNALTTGFQAGFKQAGLGKSSGSACSILSIANTTPAP